ncbi:MAG: hypothetical protein K6U09_11910 [Acidobacteriia bacterium]|jgi:hypothetical protein|nr:hypothetical protein [Terriglobia bacterium]
MVKAARSFLLVVLGATFAAALAGSGLLWPQASAAQQVGRLPMDLVAMFPKDIGEFAYADLRSARRYAWFPQLREQLTPSRFKQFEQFLASVGLDPANQVHEAAWALVPPTETTGEQIVGIAVGSFSPESTEANFRQLKLPVVEHRGFRLYAYGSGAGPQDIFFFFLDSTTAAFGHRNLVEQLIEVRYGAAEGLLRNDQMFPLIHELNGRGLVWAVLDRTYTQVAMKQLVPEAAQFPEASRIAAKVQYMTILVNADRDVNTQFHAVCANTEDANLLAATLQAGLLYRRYQAQQANQGELVQLLDAIRITPRGERLELLMALNQDLLQALLRRNLFLPTL